MCKLCTNLALLIFAITLFMTGTAAASLPAGAQEYRLQIDSAFHQKFGLYYPLTCKFNLPAGGSGLIAQIRRDPAAAWETLPEKKKGDLFNGIDAVRFDYEAGWAFISASFNRSSDSIFLRVVDDAGKPVEIAFDSLPRYYDDRKGAVVITLDDWAQWADSYFRSAVDYAASNGLYFSVGLITQDVPWSSVQEKIDQHQDQMEIASHSIHHSCNQSDYKTNEYTVETLGSRDAIRNNLSFRDHPYIPLYIEPCGYSDSSLEAAVTAADYLLTRSVNDYFPVGTSFRAWDPVKERYGRAGVAFNDYDSSDDDVLLSTANSLFDQAIAGGGIYHLMDHPWLGLWHEGSHLLQHLNYIKGRSDLWYAPLGHLYQYHFLQEMHGNLTVQPIAVTSLTASFSASPLSGAPPLEVTFTDTSTGSITSWNWDFGDGGISTIQNPVHSYSAAGSYTVRLTVSGPDGSNAATKTSLINVVGPGPVASFTASPTSGTAPMSVAFSDTSTGKITSWSWDFGDGGSSTTQNPFHVYSAAGSYTVRLTVAGAEGSNSATMTSLIKVAAAVPVVSFTASPTSGTAPLSVAFSDTSTGIITGWAWDFGDGSTSAERNPVHVYTTAGTFAVKLTVTGPGGSASGTQGSLIQVLAPPPVAEFSATPLTGAAPLSVKFADASTGTISSWLWEFGDGTSSVQQKPIHIYAAPGSYTVRLTVTGAGGSSTKTKADFIVVVAPPPAAGFTATPRNGKAPLSVSFTDSSTGTISSWLWDFGDQSTSTERNPVHVFAAGSYTVRLTVTGPGGSSTKTQSNYIRSTLRK